MRRLTKALLTLALAAFFTIFFQVDSRQWEEVGHDLKTGDVYLYNRRSLRRSASGVFTVDMKARRGASETAIESFEIDCHRRTIRNLSRQTPEDMIPPGSVAESLWTLLRDLPSPSLQGM